VGEDEMRDRLHLCRAKVERVDAPVAEPKSSGKAASALEILLDGVEARITHR